MSDLSAYHDLIARKAVAFRPQGFTSFDEAELPDWMFPHQRHGTAFALRAGTAALFYDTGLGKTGMALAWGDEVVRRTNKPVLMLAPLAVAAQHVAEAERFGIVAAQSRTGAAPVDPKIVVTNYERLDKVNPELWGGVILDESSILKSFTGKTTRKLILTFERTPYRLACSATPAPNDHTELGQHSEFLGVMHSPEMLSRWFIADQTNMGRYRLKKPAVRHYWDWVASWARCVSKPSDLGLSDAGFEMPPLNMHRHLVSADRGIDAGEEKTGQGMLFRIPDLSATSVHREKRLTTAARAAKLAEIVTAEPAEPWVIWVETDYDADAVKEVLPDAVEVRGSMPIDKKEERLQGFASGAIRILLTKPSIAGYGLNYQHCARQAFMGLSFSYESFYQAVRRCWRFRQTRPVDVHVICADTEDAIWQVVSRKAGDHDAMKAEMAAAMARVALTSRTLQTYQPEMEAALPAWMLP
ncbi:DEAD/DEAH box helicase [Jiella avicenniae]|uniref:DEAD/DEAH box helicase n=1 Tax=Jiella avicenniae TaxID=2907202 RepID=A0A9X1P249_9HYPH|nr:DEAD/DEAH box helicase [Jiella avicenniae]MCE7028454.1 DEAD/DEAH box helicase [Jiella avicenniae]